MSSRKYHRPLLFGLALTAMTRISTRADDWPQWRGPLRDGVWRETGIIETFASAELTPAWTAKIGPGYSGPTVAGDAVFLTDRVNAPEQQERILCFDRLTGRPRWTHAYPCVYRDIDYALGPRAGVTVADGRAFAFGAMGHAHAMNAADGRVLWSRDLATEYKVNINVWAVSAAPLVVGDLVIFQVGAPPDACLVAFDVATGKERWRALDDKASYSSPRLVRIDGREVVLAWTSHWLACLEPDTGKVLWQVPYRPTKMILNVGDPILDEKGRGIFLSAFYDGAAYYELKPDFSPPQLRWKRAGTSERKTDALHSIIMTPFIRDDHVYGIDSYGEMRCLNLENGDRVWEDTTLLANGRWATAYFVQNGDRTWITTEKGEIVIARLTPLGFERISSARFITPETTLRGRSHPIAWSHPAYAHRSLFARNDSALICIPLGAASP